MEQPRVPPPLHTLHNRVFKEKTPPPVSLLAMLRSSFHPVRMSDVWATGVFRWWPTYSLALFLGDAQAALTIAVILVPQGMAYALLAGLPPVYGLYTSTIPVIIFGLLTSSAAVAPGPVAPTAIVMNAMVSSLTSAPPLSAEFIRIHLALGFVTGVMQLGMSALQLTWISDLVSYPVMNGFAFGAGMIICASQLGDTFGLTVPRRSGFFDRIIAAVDAARTGNWRTTLISLVCLYVLLQFRTWRVRGYGVPPRFPMPLAIIALLTLISFAVDLQGTAGIKLVGFIPSSLPPVSLPIVSTADIALVAPQAAILAVINYMQTVSLAKIFGRKTGEVTVPALEMLALGTSSLVGSFLSSYTVAGSFTRTTVQFEAGARTPATTIITGVFMLIFLVTITRILNYLPMCVLAVIVLASTRQLFSTDVALELWRAKRADFLQMFVCCIAVLLLDIVYGLLVGVGFSIALILLRSFQPRLVELGNLPATDVFVALTRFRESRPIPGVVILRLDGELHFGNMFRITDKLRHLLGSAAAERVAALRAPPASGTAGVTEEADALMQPGTPMPTTPNTVLAVASASSEGHIDTTPSPPPSALLRAASSTSSASSSSIERVVGDLWRRIRRRGGGGSDAAAGAAADPERLVYALSVAPTALLTRARNKRKKDGDSGTSSTATAAGVGVSPPLSESESEELNNAARPQQLRSLSSMDSASSSEQAASLVPQSHAAAVEGNTAFSSGCERVVQGPLLAVILDCSRVLDMDSTACKEVLAIIKEFKVANDKALKADNERQTTAVTTVAVAEAGEGVASTTAAATATPPPMAAVSTTPATALTLGAHTKLLLSSLPGPVRDTIDRFNKGEQDLASTRFLSLAAAVAYLQELKEEADSWGGVTSELASLAGGATTPVDGALLGRLF